MTKSLKWTQTWGYKAWCHLSGTSNQKHVTGNLLIFWLIFVPHSPAHTGRNITPVSLFRKSRKKKKKAQPPNLLAPHRSRKTGTFHKHTALSWMLLWCCTSPPQNVADEQRWRPRTSHLLDWLDQGCPGLVLNSPPPRTGSQNGSIGFITGCLVGLEVRNVVTEATIHCGSRLLSLVPLDDLPSELPEMSISSGCWWKQWLQH